MIGRLQLSTEKSKEEDNEGIMQLRILRVQVRSMSVQLNRPAVILTLHVHLLIRPNKKCVSDGIPERYFESKIKDKICRTEKNAKITRHI